MTSGVTLNLYPPEADEEGLPPILQQAREPFSLQLADDGPTNPLRVEAVPVRGWLWQSVTTLQIAQRTLAQVEPGRRRIRLYCSNATAQGPLRLVVSGGRACGLGRSTASMTQLLTWAGQKKKTLAFPYDRPAVQIGERTDFFDVHGTRVPPPSYHPESGSFLHDTEVSGAMMVHYAPYYSLFEIVYDTGMALASADGRIGMQQAWLRGNIYDAAIPPVRVVAIAQNQAAQLSFSRRFWPAGADLVAWGESRQETPTLPANLLRNLVEQERQTRTERIFSADDPDTYIDVERTVALTLRDTDGNTMTLRLKSD